MYFMPEDSITTDSCTILMLSFSAFFNSENGFQLHFLRKINCNSNGKSRKNSCNQPYYFQDEAGRRPLLYKQNSSCLDLFKTGSYEVKSPSYKKKELKLSATVWCLTIKTHQNPDFFLILAWTIISVVSCKLKLFTGIFLCFRNVSILY